MRKLAVLRRFSQTFFFLLFIYIFWSMVPPLKSFLPADIFFRADPNITVFTSISIRLILPGVVLSLGMIVLTLLFGRFFCGWICPLGTIMDLSAAVAGRGKSSEDISDSSSGSFSCADAGMSAKTGSVSSRNEKFHCGSRSGQRGGGGTSMVCPRDFGKAIQGVKFFVLGAIFISALAGVQIAWVFDPMVIAARFVSLNLVPAVSLFMNRLFDFAVEGLHLSGPVRDFCHTFKSSFFGARVHYFPGAGIIFIVLLLICIAAFLIPRFWCRGLCPTGALYSLVARFSVLRRTVTERCVDNCGICITTCRMGAVRADTGYVRGECILCMDCCYNCPTDGVKFRWPWSFPAKKIKAKADMGENGGLSRRDFIFLILSSIFVTGFGKSGWKGGMEPVIRPPGVSGERDFLKRCIRCSSCLKVCPTHGLQPVMLQTGVGGIWTPHLVPEIGYCEYNCTLCGEVCPTGAIPRLSREEKRKTRIGVASINRLTCIAWAYNMECVICQRYCPVPGKAVKVKEVNVKGRIVRKAYVAPELCIGCGICQTKCPVRPVRAIRVKPLEWDRGA